MEKLKEKALELVKEIWGDRKESFYELLVYALWDLAKKSDNALDDAAVKLVANALEVDLPED